MSAIRASNRDNPLPSSLPLPRVISRNVSALKPMLATRADTGEVLHVRRRGSAASPRGALRFVDELLARIDRAGASGEKLFRGDSAFWNVKLMARLERAGWR